MLLAKRRRLVRGAQPKNMFVMRPRRRRGSFRSLP